MAIEILNNTHEMSRREFLRGSSVIAAGIGVAALGLYKSEGVDAAVINLSREVTAEERTAGRDQILRLYPATFGRNPDDEGLNYHLTRYQNEHLSIDRIAGDFTASSEWYSKYGGLDNSGIVSQLYRNVLGREAEPSGHAHWVGALAVGESMESVLTKFSDSPELVANTSTTPPKGRFLNMTDIEYAHGIGGPAVPVNGKMQEISFCESGNNPTVQNRASTASGLYQFLDGSWSGFQGKTIAVYPWLAPLATRRAKEAAVPMQHLVAYMTMYGNLAGGGIQHWNASRNCWR